ncbi:M3 family metallopeptidase [Clavibacter michiganensis]|uniref:M3 family metallopeptidase n=1 Tax=Clavibacter michiganensis TaxID=28447 RepID=UPI0013663D18|nr:M3 family metallopeptidase [Clavibacter michiganensis]MDO4041256.1 M3 family metallopeptidase [Clavibacter michiganensis]MDO4058786.1 M3 family metallopeptidase [Clavibacter michiganensis]MDO4076875.1 M3 family metallopeptidase [Clavibacter michiganensis]MDO4093626.1 M3 family metallopeptidase [Clavibacter michiganensis]MDO4102275.1 M3 family metallopeptidase [Clavibacter michiganensis]
MTTPPNPFLEPSTLPYGMPPFADIREEHFRPAFQAGIAEHLAEVRAIADSPEPPAFENTLVALERAGRTLDRVGHVFFTLSSADSSPFTRELDAEIAPELAAHEDAIRLDAALYARIRAVHDARHDSGLDAESVYLVERYLAEFTIAGAGLDDDAKDRLRDLNRRLSVLTTRFESNLLEDTNDLAVVVDDVAELDGLGAGAIAAAAQAAADRGLEGKHLITLVLPTGHPYLSQLTDRGLRQRIMEASLARGARENEYDNRPLVLEITRLRAERAALLGFPSHAAAITADQTARTPEAVADMLGRLAPAAARNARAEAVELQRVIDRTQEERGEPTFELAAWDWAFYSERVRTERYDVDTERMRPYLEADRVLRDGVFRAATALYGVTFTERDDIVAYHPDARVFEVRDEDGSPVGLYVLDLHTRDSKRGGAWMNPLISQSALLDTPTVVLNNLNVPKPPAGQPTLLSYDETTTLFHEFGHALHGLFARVTYPRFAGTNVFRDFVEFPSQVNEMWMLWSEILASYAVHHETGEPMPAELVAAVQASSAFNEGFLTSEYLGAALLDQAWHRIGVDDRIEDVDAFQADALAAVGLDVPAVLPRYASSYFQHTFAGGYDAGYYSYIWSEVLDADTVEWFRENGGLTRDNGDRFRSLLLGVGGSKDPLEAYRDFRGRDAVIEPLLERRGLAD